VQTLGRNSQLIESDQHPRSVNDAKIPQLKPAFVEDGTVTAANSSAISDGAAALVLMRADAVPKGEAIPLARIVGQASFSQAPEWFTTAPVAAVRQLLQTTGWSVSDVDLFEINEAF